jgi:hypothetical protein
VACFAIEFSNKSWGLGKEMSAIKDLLKLGSVLSGDKLIWSRRVLNNSHEAVINSDGTITTSDGKKHKTPSGAAKHLNNNKPVDGWIAWKHVNSGKKLVELRTEASK